MIKLVRVWDLLLMTKKPEFSSQEAIFELRGPALRGDNLPDFRQEG
jgi:hypothetical protein